ncbi:MAG: hypothetical protein R2873_25650 [Caldilineaceae bacterium]
MTQPLSVALISIARPTFDVPLAQSAVRHRPHAVDLVRLRHSRIGDDADHGRRGWRGRGAAAADADFDLLILLQASFADGSMAVALAETVKDPEHPHSALGCPQGTAADGCG